jgi:hypothetical protein
MACLPPLFAQDNRPPELRYRLHTFRSQNQAYETPLRILEPSNLRSLRNPRVLYVLPVNPDIGFRWGDGLVTAARLGLADKHGMIVVAPSFSTWPWYADHPQNPRIRQETYFVREVVPYVDRLYPNAQTRLLAGFSKSGNGAILQLLRHPDLFAAAAAWDAPLMKTSPDQFGMSEVFATQEGFDPYSIPALLERNAELFLSKPARLAHFGYGSFQEHHTQAHEAMRRLGIPHRYDNSVKREHRWDSGWLEGAVAALDEMSRRD